jgi:hypothetical protein
MLAVATPIALVVGPSLFSSTVDMGLGVVVPYHMLVGMNIIATDYIPTGARGAAGGAIAAATLLTAMGFLRLNMNEGVTETVKDFWRVPAVKGASEESH